MNFKNLIENTKNAKHLTNREKLTIIEELQVRWARSDFSAFRRYIHPKNKTGWFQQDVEENLQQFYIDYQSGKRPKLIVEAPPQHGKSVIITDFIAWLMGKMPDNKTIYTSFSERLGKRANLTIQRIASTNKYNRVFPETILPTRKDTDKTRDRSLIELVDKNGSFRNTTVEGSITGESLDLGVIDDPLRGRKDANSITKRNSAWDWFTDDFFTRFSEEAGLLCILTRWHVDDPIGRLIEKNPDVKVLKYPALADKDAKLMPCDPRLPGSGEALFPEHKSEEFLLERKRTMAPANWSALYQQNPYIAGGNIIKGAWFERYDMLPKIKWSAVYGDTAQKAKQHNDYQCAEHWALGTDGRLYAVDMLHDKFEADELETRFPDFWRKAKARKDVGFCRYFAIEDKSSGTELIQRMRKKIKPKIPVKPIPRSTDKYTRVSDVLSYISSGYIVLPNNAPWVHDFIAECEAFTADDAHDHDDFIDPMVDAIIDMLDHNKPSLGEML